MISYSHRVFIILFLLNSTSFSKKKNHKANKFYPFIIFLFCVAMQISVCCSGNITGFIHLFQIIEFSFPDFFDFFQQKGIIFPNQIKKLYTIFPDPCCMLQTQKQFFPTLTAVNRQISNV